MSKIREQRFSTDNWKQELVERIWHCYVCPNCKLIRWHPLSYCSKCGGKYVRMVGKTEDLKAELYARGFSESGM